VQLTSIPWDGIHASAAQRRLVAPTRLPARRPPAQRVQVDGLLGASSTSSKVLDIARELKRCCPNLIRLSLGCGKGPAALRSYAEEFSDEGELEEDLELEEEPEELGSAGLVLGASCPWLQALGELEQLQVGDALLGRLLRFHRRPAGRHGLQRLLQALPPLTRSPPPFSAPSLLPPSPPARRRWRCRAAGWPAALC
jgi:hypothetical protein